MPKSKSPFLSQHQRSQSTLSTLKRTKGASKVAGQPRLEDVGTIGSLPPPGVRQDIVSLIKHIKQYSFEELPERAGMNSVQISSTLRFRASLPHIVSLAHLYALSSSPTSTERELARLTAQGVLRKISIPGRGKGGTAIGDGVVLVEDWIACVKAATLSDPVKTEYLELLKSQPLKQSVSTVGVFSEGEQRELVKAGFFTSPAALTASLSDLFALPTASLLHISSAGSSNPTGSIAAVGGAGAVHEHGGSGSMLATSATRLPSTASGREMTFSLPNTGTYLKLVASARAHLLSLLKQLSPKWKESTIDLLREKWNGGFGMAEIGEMKRIRNEGNGLFVGKTRKWKEFMGLRFEYVLAEALGSGSVELFDTGAVGPAVRMR